MVFAFTFLGLLTGCEQSVVSEPAPALPSTAPEIQATPTPEPEATVPVPPGRCDEKGFLTTAQPLEVEVIETLKDFTPNSERAVNHMCHNPLTDTIFITNKNEILEFNPKTRQLTPFINAKATGYSHDQGDTFEFKDLSQCVVDKQGNLYVIDINKIYSIEIQAKHLTILKQPKKEDSEQSTHFGSFPDFTQSKSGNIFITDNNMLYRAQGTRLEMIFKIFGSGAVMPAYEGTFPTKIDPITRWPIDVDLTGIGAIAADDKDNIYMTASPQHSLIKLTSDNTLYMIDPKGITNIENPWRSTAFFNSILKFEYHPTHKMFFGTSELPLGGIYSPFIITRDGCLGQAAPPRIHAKDISITNDGSIYGVSFKDLQILKFTVPPGLPEAAQWEPPQTWKDATGLD